MESKKTNVTQSTVVLKTDPENGHLSKDQFQAKMRKAKELESRLKAYEERAKAEIEAEYAGTDKKPEDSRETVDEPIVSESSAARKPGRPRK